MRVSIRKYEGIYSVDLNGKVHSDRTGLELKQSINI